MNYFITAFYDSALYLANAYNQTLEEGNDVTDGLAIAQKFWNASFHGKMNMFKFTQQNNAKKMEVDLGLILVVVKEIIILFKDH